MLERRFWLSRSVVGQRRCISNSNVRLMPLVPRTHAGKLQSCLKAVLWKPWGKWKGPGRKASCRGHTNSSSLSPSHLHNFCSSGVATATSCCESERWEAGSRAIQFSRPYVIIFCFLPFVLFLEGPSFCLLLRIQEPGRQINDCVISWQNKISRQEKWIINK